MTDKEIVEQIKNGTSVSSDRALTEMYRNCYKMIEHLVLTNNGVKDDAQDIFQDSMVVFYNKVKQNGFELTGKASTYLYSIARNIWLRRLRDNKKNTNNMSLEGIELVSAEDIDRELVFTEDQIILGKLLKQSGEKCVELLKAFYFEKLKIRKITELLNFSSEQVVKNQKSICLKKLKVIMMKNKVYKNTLILE